MVLVVSSGEYSKREGYKGSEYAPTYEDKDGDWMLVGDVPLESVLFLFLCVFCSYHHMFSLSLSYTHIFNLTKLAFYLFSAACL